MGDNPLKQFRGYERVYDVQGEAEDAYFNTLPDHDLGALANYLFRLSKRKPMGVMLDVGANIGLSTLLMSELCPTSKIIGFEPSPTTYGHLKANIDRNGDWNYISLQPLAVGEKAGVVKFNDDKSTSHTNHVSLSGQGISVNMTSIDGFVALHQIPEIDFIKIDVEGFELAVLKGGFNTLLRHRPTVFLEFNEHAVVNHIGMDPRDYFSQMKRTLGLLAVVNPLNGDTTPLPAEPHEALTFLRTRMKTAEDVFDLVNQSV